MSEKVRFVLGEKPPVKEILAELEVNPHSGELHLKLDGYYVLSISEMGLRLVRLLKPEWFPGVPLGPDGTIMLTRSF